MRKLLNIFSFSIFIFSYSICYAQFNFEYGKSISDISFFNRLDGSTINIGKLQSFSIGVKTKKFLLDEPKLAGTFRIHYASNDDKNSIDYNYYEGQVGFFYDPFKNSMIHPSFEFLSSYRISNTENKLTISNTKEGIFSYGGQIYLNIEFNKLSLGLGYKYSTNSNSSGLPNYLEDIKVSIYFPTN